MQSIITTICKIRIKKIYIRRTLTFTMYSLWWIVTLIAGYKYLSGIELPEGFIQFYITFSSAVTIMISFYYKGKAEEVDND